MIKITLIQQLKMRTRKEITGFIKEKILWALINYKLNKRSQYLILSALARIDYSGFKKLPECSLSFSDGENFLNIQYGSRKIEVSDYHSVDSGMGFDHFQNFCFQYFPETDRVYQDGEEIIERAEHLFQSITEQHDFILTIYREN